MSDLRMAAEAIERRKRSIVGDGEEVSHGTALALLAGLDVDGRQVIREAAIAANECRAMLRRQATYQPHRAEQLLVSAFTGLYIEALATGLMLAELRELAGHPDNG